MQEPEGLARGRGLGAVRRPVAGQGGEEARRAGRRHGEAEGEAADPRRRGGRERVPFLLRGEGRIGRFTQVGAALRRPRPIQVLHLVGAYTSISPFRSPSVTPSTRLVASSLS